MGRSATMPAMRHRLAWLSTAPLMLAGLLAGHTVGYRLAFSDPHARADALGHRDGAVVLGAHAEGGVQHLADAQHVRGVLLLDGHAVVWTEPL